MADYKVTFKASVHKDLSNLPKELVTRLWQRLEILKQQPFPRQAAKLEGSEGLYRLRVGDYRIILWCRCPGKRSRCPLHTASPRGLSSAVAHLSCRAA